MLNLLAPEYEKFCSDPDNKDFDICKKHSLEKFCSEYKNKDDVICKNLTGEQYCGKFENRNSDICKQLSNEKYCNDPANWNKEYCQRYCVPGNKCPMGAQLNCSDNLIGNNNILGNARCREYCELDQPWCYKMGQALCAKGANLYRPECKLWCKNNGHACFYAYDAHCRARSHTLNPLFTDSACADFCGTIGKILCEQRKEKFCNDAANIGTLECQSWCKDNRSKCVTGYREY